MNTTTPAPATVVRIGTNAATIGGVCALCHESAMHRVNVTDGTRTSDQDLCRSHTHALAAQVAGRDDVAVYLNGERN